MLVMMIWKNDNDDDEDLHSTSVCNEALWYWDTLNIGDVDDDDGKDDDDDDDDDDNDDDPTGWEFKSPKCQEGLMSQRVQII